VLFDRTQDLLFELRAHPRQRAELLLQAQFFQFVDGGDWEMLEQDGDTLGSESLNFQKLQRSGRIFEQPEITPLAGSTLENFPDYDRQPFSNPRNIGDLAIRIPHDIFNPLRISLDRGGAIPVAADAEGVFARDLHQIGGFVEAAGDFSILHV